MGMYDTFRVQEGQLPNNKIKGESDFQTKSLSCSLDLYRIDMNNNVYRKPYASEEEGDQEPITDTAYIYSHEFLYEDAKEGDLFGRGEYLGCKYQEYKLIIVENKIVFCKKTVENGYDKTLDQFRAEAKQNKIDREKRKKERDKTTPEELREKIKMLKKRREKRGKKE